MIVFGYRTLATAAALALAASATPAMADGGTLKIKPGKDWTHKESRIRLPGKFELGALSEAKDFSSSQSDVGLTYQDGATQTTTSVYVFRGSTAEPSVWQDRIAAIVTSAQNRLGTIKAETAIHGSFTPFGRSIDSGSLLVYAGGGNPTTATGSAVMTSGEWVVAVRMSSRSLSPADLEQRLSAFASSIVLPSKAKGETETQAYVVKPCAEAANGPDAERSAGGMKEAIFVTLLGSAATQATGEEDMGNAGKEALPRPYCRVAYDAANPSVYSQDGENHGYLVVAGDSGPVGTLLGMEAEGLEGVPRYAVALVSSEQMTFYRGFSAFPTVMQFMNVLEKERPIGGIGRTPSTRRQINVVPVAEEKQP